MSDTTTRQHLPLDQGPPNVSRLTLHHGHRHRCIGCTRQGKQGEPTRMCHHCGRLLCEACVPRLPRLVRPFFQHQEMKWRSGRGQRRPLVGERWMEAVHCDEHVHYAPRLVPWMGAGAVAALLLLVVLYFGGASPLWVLVGPVLLFSLWAVWGIAWRGWDARRRQTLFFPLDTAPVTLQLTESFEAEGVLDGEYVETWRGWPRGELEVTVPLRPTLEQELADFQHAHGLTPAQLNRIPATAGSVVVEEVQRVVHERMAWDPQTGQRLEKDVTPWGKTSASRRWQLAAPLSRWSFPTPEERTGQKTLTYRYAIDWWVARQPFRFPFPVQLHAHFPEASERRTLALTFLLTEWAPTLTPFVKFVRLQRGEALPPFTLLPLAGRTIRTSGGEGAAATQLEVDDLPIEADNRATLLLRFDRPPPHRGEAWLTGSICVGVAGTLSGMKIAGVYDPLGNRVQRPREEVVSWATLQFRVNVASVPSFHLVHHIEAFTLPGTNMERDDAIVSALQKQAHVARVQERVPASRLPADGPPLPPVREITGSPPQGADDRSPLVFHIELRPDDGSTHVHLRVEESVTDTTRGEARAARYGQVLKRLIQKAAADFND